MKLRNKLIPLASVFATGAVLAPATLTACSASGMVDLTNGNYVPSTKKAVTEGYKATEAIATEIWMAAVNENPQVLKDDSYWGNALLVKGYADMASINMTNIKSEVKDVSVKYVTVKNAAGEDTKIPTVSMTLTVTTQADWYVTGKDELPFTSYIAKTGVGIGLGYPLNLFTQWSKYFYDENVAGNIVSNKTYEAKWENIPVTMEKKADIATDLPTINTDWLISPDVEMLLAMDTAKLDWKYSIKFSKADTFTFDLDGAKTSKVYGSTLDRSYNNYYDIASSTTGESYTNGSLLLYSEKIASYYLSDIKWVD